MGDKEQTARGMSENAARQGEMRNDGENYTREVPPET